MFQWLTATLDTPHLDLCNLSEQQTFCTCLPSSRSTISTLTPYLWNFCSITIFCVTQSNMLLGSLLCFHLHAWKLSYQRCRHQVFANHLLKQRHALGDLYHMLLSMAESRRLGRCEFKHCFGRIPETAAVQGKVASLITLSARVG